MQAATVQAAKDVNGNPQAVTIVLTGSSSSSYATVNFANNAKVSVTAPTTGPTAGIAFLGDPKD